MRRAAGARDDHFETAARLRSTRTPPSRSACGAPTRPDTRAQSRIRTALCPHGHRLPVGLAAHDDADERLRFGHALISTRSTQRTQREQRTQRTARTHKGTIDRQDGRHTRSDNRSMKRAALLIVLALAAPARGADEARRLLHAVQAAERPHRDPARGPQRAARHRQHVVPRRLRARAHRPDRIRASLRTPDVHGIGPRQARRVRRTGSNRPAATTTARRRTIGPTTGSTCRRTPWSWRSSSNRIAWATCSTR